MKLKTLLLSIMLLTSACSTTGSRHGRSDVRVDMIIPESAVRIELQSKQRFFAPAPIDTPLPDFPARDPATDGQVVICSELVVSEGGSVTSDAQIDDAPGCEAVASEESQRLYSLVRQAVHRWQYFGAAICDYEMAESECNESAAKLSPVAVRLAYKFTFTTAHGRRSVSTDAIRTR